jgi:superfamily II DNA or RNA helicase
VALSHLIKHIYNFGSEEVIKRGKKIHALGNVELMEYDELLGNITFRVKDDSYNTYYKVYINQFNDTSKPLPTRCTCPYNLSEVCRHKAGALFTLQDLLDKNLLGDKGIEYNQQHTVIKMKQLDVKLIRMLSSTESFVAAENFLQKQSVSITQAKDERVKVDVTLNGETHTVVIQKNEERNFDTSCTCNSDKEHPLCIHKTLVFLQLYNKKGANYFDTIRNWDAVKNKLLGMYGYSLADDLTNKFEFTYTDGKPFLRVLDATIKKVVTLSSTEKRQQETEITNRQNTSENTAPILQNDATLPTVTTKTTNKLGLVFNEQSKKYPFIELDIIKGETAEDYSGYVGKIEKVDINKFVDTSGLTEDDTLLLQNVRKLLHYEVNKYVSRNSPFSAIWENFTDVNTEDLPAETRQLINEYFHPKLKKIFADCAGSNFCFFLPPTKPFITAHLEHAEIISSSVEPFFAIQYTDNQYEVECLVKLPNIELPIHENECASPLIIQYHNQLFTWQNAAVVEAVFPYLQSGKITITAADWPSQLQDYILPLSKQYHVHFGNLQKEEIKDVLPDCKILLREKGEYLVLQPVFSYKGYEINPSDKEKIVLPSIDRLLIIQRNIDAENAFLTNIENLHSNFLKPNNDSTLALKGADVLKNNWFFLFVDAVKEMNVTVYGFDALRNFRFNTAKPSTKIFISSNTDWFDAKVEILFGDMQVTVDDVRKALINKQQYVQLQDGTLGILPEEWVKKYSLLFRVGDGSKQNIKLSKYHFSVIEELYEQRNEEELFFQLEEKYERLKEHYGIQPISAPANLKPILRPYQESGFQWLHYLKEVQWGGILADDMGLGKTVQTLSFISYLKEEQKSIKALVVCPTTLMYNWRNEIEKFTPNVSYYIHHGGGRLKESLQQDHIDVIITTYGTLRSDIKQFVEINFDYVVLDESQAIKNPSSKVAKAACLLQAKNRLCLSGTPLQNNTFDIFAQMNFLNPGMLGSIEFFRQEFAIPIDKFGEKEQKDHLRKLLYPFILRRTKEQVAKDLPEKQEMVLFCEMGDEQRKIYDAYRNDFRDRILGMVETQGVGKSQLTILQGLMKLRQICDSPYIINEAERYPNVSVKLEEIGREITENISNHKALIFSQFLGMLALIKQKLKELGVQYEYFDGSTSATDREKAIQNFQNNDECRVFLISLKAGGVGLNLTAADYVYIVDPWWNPAVEQQAIDRTHRIGQTKNVFAYRMICTDTVEDKILKLQERKKALARDLITDDEGFVKSLTKADVEYLFS